MEKDMSLLKNISLFDNLGDAEITQILSICTQVSFGKDEIIMQEGDVGDTMYIIVKGTVEVAKTLVLQGMDLDDKEQIGNKVFSRLHAQHNPVFGEISLLEESARTATIKTLTDCTFYEIKKDDFLQLAEQNYELGYKVLFNIAKTLCTRLSKANEDIVKLTTVLSLVLKDT